MLEIQFKSFEFCIFITAHRIKELGPRKLRKVYINERAESQQRVDTNMFTAGKILRNGCQ